MADSDVEDLIRDALVKALTAALVKELRDEMQPPTPIQPPTEPVAERQQRIIRAAELRVRLGLSETTIWRMRKRGEFPDPIKISRGAVGWREADIEEWIRTRKAQRS